jgi:hypothetical protein
MGHHGTSVRRKCGVRKLREIAKHAWTKKSVWSMLLIGASASQAQVSFGIIIGFEFAR